MLLRFKASLDLFAACLILIFFMQVAMTKAKGDQKY